MPAVSLLPSSAIRMLDHIAGPIFVLDIDTKGEPVYAAFNSYALLNAGFVLEDILGLTAVEVYPGSMGRIAYARHKRVAETGISMTYELELPLMGRKRNVRTTLSPQKDETGRVIRLYGTSIDITAEQTAREVQVSLDTLTSEMEQFITMAAHDLRTPMRNVAALAEMLRDDFNDMGDGKLEIIDMMSDLAEKSMELISDVLTHARATSTKQDQCLFEFGTLCQNIYSVLDPQGLHKMSCSDVPLLGDQTAMQIVLRNLMDNVLKHGGRERMHLKCLVRPRGIDRVEVSLSDTGIGFDNPGIAFLDSGEFQVDSGYGLLGIRRLINARGGEISAQNNINGAGSTVHFTLPCQWKGDPGELSPAQTGLKNEVTKTTNILNS